VGTPGDPGEQTDQRLDVLGSGDECPLVDQERRDPGDVELLGPGPILLDLLDQRVALEDRRSGAGVESGSISESDERRGVRDVLTVGEVGGEECLDQSVLACGLTVGPLDQPMGRQRVDPLGQVEPVVDARLDPERDEPGGHGVERTGAVPLVHRRPEVLRVTGCCGVELEGPPTDLDVVRVEDPGSIQFLECRPETPGSEVAPRTDHIGEQLDQHGQERSAAPAAVAGRRDR